MTETDIVVDTNAYSDWQRGLRWLPEFASVERIWMPFIAVGELLAGFAAGGKAKANRSVFENFLRADSVKISFADAETSTVYADIYGSLKEQGRMIPTNDMWIAALCVQHRRPLASGDRHFEYVPMLKLVG